MTGRSAPTTKYTPFYCEENIWHLAASRAWDEAWVIFLSNADRQIPLWMQRASSHPSKPIVWDYHVILLEKTDARYLVWDLDTYLPCPSNANEYAQRSILPSAPLEDKWRIQFRMIEHQVYLEHFSSDRSHMKDPQSGTWIREPPTWDCIQSSSSPHNLHQLIDMTTSSFGEVISESMFIARYCT